MNGFLFIIFGGFMTTQVQDGLITASVVKRMFGDISDMSLWRWVSDLTAKGYGSRTKIEPYSPSLPASLRQATA